MIKNFFIWLFNIHVHKREVFCVGQYAFVKCMDCGNESLPWSVSKKVAQEWKESHPDAIERLTKINERFK